MSSQKKHDLPWQKWEWPTWFSDFDVRALPLDTRMVWAEMIGRMWLSNERGYLTSNGKPYTDESIARTLPLSVEEYRIHLERIEAAGLFSRRKSDGAIFSRKILHDLELYETKVAAGQKGGLAKAKQSASRKLAHTRLLELAGVEPSDIVRQTDEDEDLKAGEALAS